MSTHFPDSLKERDEARRFALEQQKAKRQEEKKVEETSEHFNREFESKKNAVCSLLEVAENLPKEQLPSHFEKVNYECQILRKYLSDSSLFLSKYVLKVAQEQLIDLLELINSKQDQLLPRKKFAFRSRKKEVASKSEPKEAKMEQTPAAAASAADANSKMVKDKEKEKLELKPDEVKGQDVHLSSLKECEVMLFGTPSTLLMTNINGCKVLCGPVCSSIFIEHCSDCVFVVACQQLRVHSTTSSQFYLHVTSSAVIEDSKQLTFAPYVWTYPDIQSHYEQSGLDQSTNNWDKVNDFNWLASKDPSPNWIVLPEDKRTIFSD